VYLFNFHPFLNRYLARQAQQHGSVSIQHIQEPYVDDKSVYGGFRAYWLPLFELLQEETIRHVDVVVLSSSYALALFDRRYPGFTGKKLLIPLMYEDLGKSTDTEVTGRRFVTFVGPPSKAKGAEKFSEIVKYCFANGLDYQFLLVSGRHVRTRGLDKFRNVTILQKPHISDRELGEALKMSLMTLTPYTVATQSSVIPVSYMYGTPVVSSNVGGLPEEVADDETGILLEPDAPVDQWIDAISYTRSQLPKMAKACRRMFEARFAGANWERYLDGL
jgi:glycosyltransferase involved in cell wall biosynthesis